MLAPARYWCCSGDAADHRADHGPAEEGLGVVGAAFVVPCETAVGGGPAECPFHDPASWEYFEGLLAGFLLHGLDGGAEDLFRPVDEGAGEALVGEQVPAAAVFEVEVDQELAGASTVLDAGWDDEHDQQEAEGVGDDETLAAVDFLAGVVAAGAGGDGLGALDRLGVEYAGRRFGGPAFGCADLVAQRVVVRFRDAVFLPGPDAWGLFVNRVVRRDSVQTRRGTPQRPVPNAAPPDSSGPDVSR